MDFFSKFLRAHAFMMRLGNDFGGPMGMRLETITFYLGGG